MNSCQPNKQIDLSVVQLQMVGSIQWDIKPLAKHCLSSARLMERLCHRPGNWRWLLMTLGWKKADSLREQQSMKEFSWETRHCFPCQTMPLLNKHSSGGDVLWQRGAIVVVSSWQRDRSQNTAMTVRGGRKEGEQWRDKLRGEDEHYNWFRAILWQSEALWEQDSAMCSGTNLIGKMQCHKTQQHLRLVTKPAINSTASLTGISGKNPNNSLWDMQ